MPRGDAPRTVFAVAPLLREIGRGKHGARGLNQTQAQALMDAILAGAVGDLELGGVLLALRMKGESADEVAGFRAALAAHVQLVSAPVNGAPVVVIPSYNGARRLPNLVPLLAMVLAREGVPVLIHGQASEPDAAAGARTRVTTFELAAALGLAVGAQPEDAAASWQAGRPALLPLRVLAPSLARLIALRRRLGVRNIAHTLAKLLAPVDGPTLLLSSHTHPEFAAMLAELFAAQSTAALSMRGTEGEAVANARRAQKIYVWLDGVCTSHEPPERSLVPGDDADAALPANDVDATATWTKQVLAGAVAVPAPIAAQVAIIRAALAQAAR